MKIPNIDWEILYNFWSTWETLKKLLGKMWLKIIWKVAKNQGFSLSLEDIFFEKSQGREWRAHFYMIGAWLKFFFCISRFAVGVTVNVISAKLPQVPRHKSNKSKRHISNHQKNNVFQNAIQLLLVTKLRVLPSH